MFNNGAVSLQFFCNPNDNKKKVAVEERITQLQRCDGNEVYFFFFELIIQISRPRCIPIEYSNLKRYNKRKIKKTPKFKL